MTEVNLLDKYPKSHRAISARGQRKLSGDGYLSVKRESMTNDDIYFENALIQKAKLYQFEYFDGDRLYGYGGYTYDPKYCRATAHRIIEHYKLTDESKILELGCAKGYLLYEIREILPNAVLVGLDISEYAINNAKEEMRSCIKLHDLRERLPFNDNEFDLIIAINTLSELEIESCSFAIKEITRVGKGNSFITLNAWKNDTEKDNLLKWNLTAQSNYHVNDWKKILESLQYGGDYFWFIAE